MNIYMNSHVNTKLWTTIRALKTEVGGFGYARLEGKDLVWYEVFLVPQKVSGSEVEFDEGGIMAAIDRAASDGVLDDPEFIWVSWHSHHTLGAFWSNTDADCIKTYGDLGIKYLLSFVGCHDLKYKMRLDYFGVEHGGLSIDQVTLDDLKFELDLHDPVFSDIYEEIEANVRKQKAPVKSKFVPMKHAPKTPYTPPSVKLDAAFAVKELMDEYGVSETIARNIIGYDEDGDYANVAGEVVGGFDQMAWGAGS